MDVKFISVAKNNLGIVPTVDGQVIALEDSNGFYYDMDNVRYSVSKVEVCEQLSGIGDSSTAYIVSNGSNAGVYVWSDAQSSFVLIANKDTDTYLSIVNNKALETSYIVGTDGDLKSRNLYWNSNVYADIKNGTITAKEFKGKASDSYKSDTSKQADSADTASTADVANKIGTATVGDEFKAVYVLNGVPTACAHSVKKDVPENAVFTDTTYGSFKGATQSGEGSIGLVPKPSVSDRTKFLRGDGTWSYVETSVMKGCTRTESGSSGLVPAPSVGKYNSFLKGDGTWASYSAGYGLELSSLTFNLQDSGVAPGVYGPTPNAEDMTKYVSDYIPVPRITVDKYGRVTNIEMIDCGVAEGTAKPQVTYGQFSFTPDNQRLLFSYDNMETAVAKFNIDDNGHLIAEYRYDPTPATLSRQGDHVIATSTKASNVSSASAESKEVNNA